MEINPKCLLSLHFIIHIVGWGISNTLDADASLSVLKQAIKDHGKPEIINSDQGSQFTCEIWVRLFILK